MAGSTLTTVVVIAHNYGRFLADAVRSVIEQTTCGMTALKSHSDAGIVRTDCQDHADDAIVVE